jgi:uncharacterized protein (DUF488 family)
MAKPTVYTIGHSTRSIDELVAALNAVGVEVLVDVRSLPGSRRVPQFDGPELREVLGRVGIRYVHLPDLGGRRGRTAKIDAAINAGWNHRAFHSYADYAMTAPFRSGLRELLQLAKRPTAIMCAEAVWWRCHRRIVADHLIARGVPVVHLFDDAHAEEATPTPFAVLDGAKVAYPAAAP